MMKAVLPLNRLGYNRYLGKDRPLQIATSQEMARVIVEHKGAYRVATINGEFRALVTGKKMANALSRDDYPAVGDWVIIKASSDDTKIIEDILPRKTTLHKKHGGKADSQLIATNVDMAFIVESIGRDYNLNRFERYIVLAQEGGIKPVIIINKSDLINDSEMRTVISEIKQRFSTIDVIETSTITDSGLVMLANFIKPGSTYCFLGSSGVGKSSIINRLLSKELIATKSVGVKTGRGRHTTSARHMYFLESGGIIIDNPGSREVGLTNATTGLKKTYINIEECAQKCKFKDCTHTNEPGCAVLRSLRDGLIDELQFNNYKKLHKETEYYEFSSYEKRQKNKKFGKFIKTAKKELKEYHKYA